MATPDAAPDAAMGSPDNTHASDDHPAPASPNPPPDACEPADAAAVDDHTPAQELEHAAPSADAPAASPEQALPSTHYSSDLPYHSPRPVRYHTAYLSTSNPTSVEPTPSPGHEPTTSLNAAADPGNSPAGSPGLFDFNQAPIRPVLASAEQTGYYSSPYLHFTHRQVPKETHVADVDVDPISGRKIINQYEIIDELGRGVHGKVKLGRSLETGQYVAIKIVERYSKRRRLGKNTSHEDKIRREIAILKKARHPNIVGLLEVIDDPSRKKVYIVLEHVEMGEVRWRTEGAKEIVLIEHRRYERERRKESANERNDDG
ncbi:hypothetical protein GTA08_BOTSDO00942 [Neofusicoccum parvum]|nr:hypothetical protein GTA08_BOTSDO00942 [Neofusicoccum parvum]